MIVIVVVVVVFIKVLPDCEHLFCVSILIRLCMHSEAWCTSVSSNS